MIWVTEKSRTKYSKNKMKINSVELAGFLSEFTNLDEKFSSYLKKKRNVQKKFLRNYRQKLSIRQNNLYHQEFYN